MKAKDLLKEIVKAYPDVVAIARDKSGDVFIYKHFIPKWLWDGCWDNTDNNFIDFSIPLILEWNSQDWTECIVTINDLQNEEL